MHQSIQTPILVRNKKIYYLNSHENLLNFLIKKGDLYVVNNHGEIIPFLALAMKQGVLKLRNNLILHIDAHFDDKIKTKNYNSKNTQKLINAFLNANTGSKEEILEFKKLCKYIKGDIETFLASLGEYFAEITALIRPEDCNQTYFYPPMPFDTYLRQNNEERINFPINPKLAVDRLKDKEINLISIDADYFACLRENDDFANLDKCLTRSKSIIDALLQLKTDRRLDNCLYTISVDKKWCKHPKEFLEIFLKYMYNVSVQVIS